MSVCTYNVNVKNLLRCPPKTIMAVHPSPSSRAQPGTAIYFTHSPHSSKIPAISLSFFTWLPFLCFTNTGRLVPSLAFIHCIAVLLFLYRFFAISLPFFTVSLPLFLCRSSFPLFWQFRPVTSLPFCLPPVYLFAVLSSPFLYRSLPFLYRCFFVVLP